MTNITFPVRRLTILAVVLGCPNVWAGVPTTQECLAASEESIVLDNEHKLLAERAALLICAAESCPTEIRKECILRTEAVNASIPTIIFEYKDQSGQDSGDVEVWVDGQLLAKRLEGTAIEIDPGPHRFSFKHRSLPPLDRQFVITVAQRNRREVISAVPETLSKTPAAPSNSHPTNRSLGAQRIAALGVGGLGVVGIVIGGAFGLTAMSKKTDAESVCPDSSCPTDAGSSLWHDAKVAGNLSTIAFLAGGAAGALGMVLWLTASPDAENRQAARTFVGIAPGMVQLKGSF